MQMLSDQHQEGKKCELFNCLALQVWLTHTSDFLPTAFVLNVFSTAAVVAVYHQASKLLLLWKMFFVMLLVLNAIAHRSANAIAHRSDSCMLLRSIRVKAEKLDMILAFRESVVLLFEVTKCCLYENWMKHRPNSELKVRISCFGIQSMPYQIFLFFYLPAALIDLK